MSFSASIVHICCVPKIVLSSSNVFSPLAPSAVGLHMTADSVAWSNTKQSPAGAYAITFRHKNTNTHTLTLLPDAVEAGGGQAGSWGKETYYTLCYTNSHTWVCAHTYALAHSQAAQLRLNGVSSLTYFFTVTQSQTVGTLTININSAIKLAIKPTVRMMWMFRFKRGAPNLTYPDPSTPPPFSCGKEAVTKRGPLL